MNHEILGRKVFVLNPLSVMSSALIEILLAAEYEVYVLKDREQALRVLRRFPLSVLFVNVDSGGSEQEWEHYVTDIMADPELNGVRIGVLSYNPGPELARRYLMDIGVPCGVVRLKLGVWESARIMLKALRANEARGRRKYVRVEVGDDPYTGFNVRIAGVLREGTILDISSVGMACRFREVTDLSPKTRFPDLQLRLRSAIVRVPGIVLSRRSDDLSVYVVLFDHRMETKPRYQIRMYIHRRLQEEIDRIAGP